MRPDDIAEAELHEGALQLERGDSTTAIKTLAGARDRMLTAYGNKDPRVARFDEALARAHRARGNLRKALELHAENLALRAGDDAAIATSLYERAQTKFEAGDLDGVRYHAGRAPEEPPHEARWRIVEEPR